MPGVRSEQGLHGTKVGFIDGRGIKWKDHIYEEHNFRKMINLIIYLLDKPANQCTFFEISLKKKIRGVDITFFEDLKMNKKVDRLKLASGGSQSQSFPG